MVMLRDEVGGGILAGRKRSAVDDAEQFTVFENQRIFHRGQLLIETDLVFFEVFAPDKASLVVCFFRITCGGETSYLAALDTIATNLFEAGACAVNQNR